MWLPLVNNAKKLSELEGEYKYWDARSKLLEAETQMKPKLPLAAQQRLRLQKAPQQLVSYWLQAH